MMKKIFILLTAIFFFGTSITVSAEDILNNMSDSYEYSLPSGVEFGDSIEEVKEKESKAGLSAPSESQDEDTDNVRLFYEGTFVGISDSTLRYVFYGTEGLYNVGYVFGDLHNYENKNNEFNSIKEQIIQEVGEPLYDDGNGVPFMLLNYKDDNTVTGWAYYNYMSELYSTMSVEIELCRYVQWLVKCEGYYVLIDHCIIGEHFDTDDLYSHHLRYIYLDEETVLNTLNNFSSDSESKKSDIYDDPETIKQVQETLNSKGYDCGTPDGVAGERTNNAIIRYKTDNNLSDLSSKITHDLLVSLGIMEEKATEEGIEELVEVDNGFYREFADKIDSKIELRESSDTLHVTREFPAEANDEEIRSFYWIICQMITQVADRKDYKSIAAWYISEDTTEFFDVMNIEGINDFSTMRVGSSYHSDTVKDSIFSTLYNDIFGAHDTFIKLEKSEMNLYDSNKVPDGYRNGTYWAYLCFNPDSFFIRRMSDSSIEIEMYAEDSRTAGWKAMESLVQAVYIFEHIKESDPDAMPYGSICIKYVDKNDITNVFLKVEYDTTSLEPSSDVFQEGAFLEGATAYTQNISIEEMEKMDSSEESEAATEKVKQIENKSEQKEDSESAEAATSESPETDPEYQVDLLGDGKVQYHDGVVSYYWDSTKYSYKKKDSYFEVSKTEDGITYTFSIIASQDSASDDIKKYTYDALDKYYSDRMIGTEIAISTDSVPGFEDYVCADTGIAPYDDYFSQVYGITEMKRCFVMAITAHGDHSKMGELYDQEYENKRLNFRLIQKISDLIDTVEFQGADADEVASDKNSETKGRSVESESAVTNDESVIEPRPVFDFSEYLQINDDAYKNISIQMNSSSDGEEDEYRNNAYKKIMEKLVELYPLSKYPVRNIEYNINSMMNQYIVPAAKENDMSVEDYIAAAYNGLTEEEFREQELVPAAQSSLAQEIILSAIGKKEGITMTDDELDQILNDYADYYSVTVEELTEGTDRETIRSSELQQKVMEWLYENTKIEDIAANSSSIKPEKATEMNSDPVWKCYAQLQAPSDYKEGDTIRITLSQNGTETTVFEGTTSFPYLLNVEGQPDELTGTAYVYLIDAEGKIISTARYDGIEFYKE